MQFADVEEGDVLIADGGFTCIAEGTYLTVARHTDGGLYVPCERRYHFLDGQVDYPDGTLIGFRRA